MQQFELGGLEVAEGRALALGEFIVQVLSDLSTRRRVVLVCGHIELGLDRVKTGFHERVFVASDLYASLIRACEPNDANPFEYLAALQEHADQVGAAARRHQAPR